MLALYRKHRPKCWDEFVGHDQVVRRLKAIEKSTGFGGRAVWLSGPSGCGKSTAALIIAKSVADDFNVEELDAGKLTPARLDDIERSMNTYAIGSKPGRAYLVDEAHGLRKDTIRQLLVVLERIPAHVVWCFTTTDLGAKSLFDGIDAHPLLSRCMEFKLVSDGEQLDFAQRVMEIARAEGLDGRPLCEYVDLIRRCKGNLRQALNAVESGEMLK